MIRSAASRGPFDLLAFKPNSQLAIQVKKRLADWNELCTLKQLARYCGLTPVVAYKRGKKIVIEEVKD